ncbi:MAG: DNA adenine methylase [Treponema sp.]|nr:DNA adenine methylase [Treponema sp.]
MQIECCDALRIIGSRDTPETFFYLDPPYVGADQGHYDGYTQMDFDALLEVLKSIQGKFLLSSFRDAALREFTRKNGWHTVEIRLSSSMTHGQGRAIREKVEVLTANYPIPAGEKP